MSMAPHLFSPTPSSSSSFSTANSSHHDQRASRDPGHDRHSSSQTDSSSGTSSTSSSNSGESSWSRHSHQPAAAHGRGTHADPPPSLFRPRVKQRSIGRRPSQQSPDDGAHQGKGFVDLPSTPPILPMRIVDTISMEELSDLVASEGRAWNAKELSAAVRRLVYFQQKRHSGGSKVGAAGRVWTVRAGAPAEGVSGLGGDALSSPAGGGGTGGGGREARAVVQLSRKGAARAVPGLDRVQLRASDAQLLQQLVLLLKPKIQYCGERQLTNLLWCYGKLQKWDSVLAVTRELCDYGHAKLREVQPQGLSNVMWVLAKAYQHQKEVELHGPSISHLDAPILSAPPSTSASTSQTQQQQQQQQQQRNRHGIPSSASPARLNATQNASLQQPQGNSTHGVALNRDGACEPDLGSLEEETKPDRFRMSWVGANAYRNLTQLQLPRVVTPPRQPQQLPPFIGITITTTIASSLTLPADMPAALPATRLSPGLPQRARQGPAPATRTLSSLAPEMLAVASGMLRERLNEYEAQGLCLLLYAAASIVVPLSSPKQPSTPSLPLVPNVWQQQLQLQLQLQGTRSANTQPPVSTGVVLERWGWLDWQ
ncbi:MAG: hypothetical protein WDW36_002113 [Sanguina aurantia]